MKDITYCADVIAKLADKFVVIRRLSALPGLAFPGGHREKDEYLSDTAYREFEEETGLELIITGTLCTKAEPGRDPRGNYVTTVFFGEARGIPKNEAGQTEVILMSREEIIARSNEFILDHFAMFKEYIEL